MANKKSKKQLHVMKKSHTGMSVIVYALMLGLLVITFLGILQMMGQHFFAAKLSGEYQAIQYLSQIYEQAKLSGEDASNTLTLSGRSFFILDEKKKIQMRQGQYTCTMQEGKISLPGFSDPIPVYLDVDNKWLKEKENLLVPNFEEIFSRIAFTSNQIGVNMTIEYDDSWEDMDEEEYKAMLQQLQEAAVAQSAEDEREYFPVWVSIPLANSQESFVAKADIIINGDEMLVILGLVGLSIFVLVVLVILMIFNLIRNARRTKKIVETYLTDAVTQGHNWTWFILKEEPVVRSARYANKKLAVIELSFINYQNFCTCHSIMEGERMLCKIYEVIKKSLTKREACAHVATSSYAVLMEYEDEDRLRTRLRSLIESLENIDRDHKFAFHLGVRPLDIERNVNGKPMRRRKLNLEEEYNNACTARLTLAGSDDSRIAFFDQKLVDEKKWIDAVMEHQEKAIANEEFVVYYQPKYNPKTRELRGAEALIRWNSPDLGFLAPGKFIPIFEKNGFITEIDHYMLTHVAADQKAWLDQGLKCVTVSVNVSRAHFIESDLAEQIRNIVDQAGTPRNLIEIELTESAFFDDKNAMISTIQKLKEYGFKVSMDDFGAGYSSLNSLKDMPLDVLKLDADFFRGETEGGRGETVVSGAIQLAKSLNMHTVAEGVEEKSQVDFLVKQECDMIQGFFYAKPLPRNEYVERMRMGYAEVGAEELAVDAETVTSESANKELESKAEVVAQEPVSETEPIVQDEMGEVQTVASQTASETEATETIAPEESADPKENNEKDNREE